MKIAMIGHKRIPSREGGIEIVVEQLAVRMAELGNSVTVYNRFVGEDKIKEFKGVKIKEVRTFKKSALNAMCYSFFATFRAIFCNYDVIHYHAEGPCVPMAIAKLFGKKCVATIHGLDWQRAKWGGFATKYLMLGEKNAAKYSDELIVLSENMQKYFKDTYNRESLLVPNGILPVVNAPAEKIKEFGLEKDGYILFLARITPEKGLDYLIDAFREIKTDKKLVIAGKIDPATEYIESIKEKVKDDDRIILTGFVEGQLLEELFSNCFVYCLPSDLEGMPISLLEAISYAAPCLVSDIPENTEASDGYAHFFKKSDKGDLKQKLEFMLENEQYKDRNFLASKTADEYEKSRAEIIKKYDWDKITDETLNIYKSVTKK